MVRVSTYLTDLKLLPIYELTLSRREGFSSEINSFGPWTTYPTPVDRSTGTSKTETSEENLGTGTSSPGWKKLLSTVTLLYDPSGKGVFRYRVFNPRHTERRGPVARIVSIRPIIVMVDPYTVRTSPSFLRCRVSTTYFIGRPSSSLTSSRETPLPRTPTNQFP